MDKIEKFKELAGKKFPQLTFYPDNLGRYGYFGTIALIISGNIRNAPYQGRSFGYTCLSNCKKKYIGCEMDQIVKLAARFDGEVFKDMNKFFISFQEDGV